MNNSGSTYQASVLPSQKPYKQVDPFTTITRLRHLFMDCGLFTAEYPYPPTDFFHSCGLFLSDTPIGELQVGFYGKGLSPKYSLASAYAELMERLQNNVLFTTSYASLFPLKTATTPFLERLPEKSLYKDTLAKNKLELDFIFGPDEQWMAADSFIEANPEVFRHIFKNDNLGEISELLNDTCQGEVLGVPFYNWTKNEVQHMPLELIYRASVSNGMCAGNTPEEALLHGICEVFERYAVHAIYRDEISPPTIPLEVFGQTNVFQMVRHLEQKYQYNILIKDCSLGKGLPVMGVLVMDTRNGQYTFNLGSDPSPALAVERCLSEMYQGGANIHFTPLHLHRDPFGSVDGRSRAQMKGSHFFRNLYTGTGAWPNSIFDPEPTYPFQGFPFPEGPDDKTDFLTAVSLVKELGHEVLIRDVSFLGFPSYLVYIPGMSEGKFGFDGTTLASMLQIEKYLPVLHNLGTDNTDALAAAARILHSANTDVLPQTYGPVGNKIRTFPTVLDNMPADIFMLLLFLRLKNYEKAFYYIDHFIEYPDPMLPKPEVIHLAMRDYVRMKADEKSDPVIEKALSAAYGNDTAQAVIMDFSNTASIFSRLQLHTCFNCETCSGSGNCTHFEVLRIVKSIQEVQKKNRVDQARLNSLFSGLTPGAVASAK